MYQTLTNHLRVVNADGSGDRALFDEGHVGSFDLSPDDRYLVVTYRVPRTVDPNTIDWTSGAAIIVLETGEVIPLPAHLFKGGVAWYSN